MNVLDLFSGIGGFSLGLERAGMRTVAFCEIEPYCRAVLAKHWPHVPCHADVRELTACQIAERVDVICGGFPCQDISIIGKGAGLAGQHSGLWREYRRIICEIRPRYVVVENVAALAFRGLGSVLGDLAALGFDAEWHCVPASAVGAPHRRDRIWIVAYGARFQSGRQEQWAERERTRQGGEPITTADAEREQLRLESGRERRPDGTRASVVAEHGPPRRVANPDDRGFAVRGQPGTFADALLKRGDIDGCQAWLPEPDVGRVADGVPSRVDRLKSLGNAVVPQIPEIIGRAIMRDAALTGTDRATPSGHPRAAQQESKGMG